MKNLTDFRKTVKTGMGLLLPLDLVIIGRFNTGKKQPRVSKCRGAHLTQSQVHTII